MNFTALAMAAIWLAPFLPATAQSSDLIHEPYLLDTRLAPRSISFENPTGEPDEGGQAASQLGPGRKGAPAKNIEPGETLLLCDIKGPATIRHIWIATKSDPINNRSLVVRAFWEGQRHPSIECPLGDLFGYAHGKAMPYCSAAHSVGSAGAMNLWLPMPFLRRAVFTLTNEGDKPLPIYFQMDYTTGDEHPAGVGRLHVLFRRENPTTERKDFEILPLRRGRGRYLGAVLGIRNLHPHRWWGEGELKVYLDGDSRLPTIVGTGSEDYVGLSWGVQQTPFFYHGCSLNQNNFVSMYRWHLPDPIVWQKEIRITMQQIAAEKDKGLVETSDDWSCAAFWYEPVPSDPLPPMPGLKARIGDLWSPSPTD